MSHNNWHWVDQGVECHCHERFNWPKQAKKAKEPTGSINWRVSGILGNRKTVLSPDNKKL